jgi:hypothetical protein
VSSGGSNQFIQQVQPQSFFCMHIWLSLWVQLDIISTKLLLDFQEFLQADVHAWAGAKSTKYEIEQA